MQTIMVTGCAGFIGSHLVDQLLALGYQVVGVDNFDPFYSRRVKENNLISALKNDGFAFYELDLAQHDELDRIEEKIDLIVHLAAKAGVRPSIENPQGYIQSNIVGTMNVLNFMRDRSIRKMAFASSSSVYGNSKEIPFQEDQALDHPISPYAFTKKSCELLNYTYHHLYQLDIVNLRFFTVFGPRQRPDLAIHKFMRLLRKGESIPMYGDGSTARDYTFISDTIDGIVKTCMYLLEHENVFEILNLGSTTPIKLTELISTLSEEAGQVFSISQLPMQPGDVEHTYADITRAEALLGYAPKTPFRKGIREFIQWYDRVIVNEVP